MAQQIDYQQYLASREWRKKRKEFIEMTYGVCERCAARPIENVHHLTYANIGNEKLSDLMGVCHPCHDYLAAERDDDPALEVIQRIIADNGLFPAKVWPGQDVWPWPPYMTRELECGQSLVMTLVTEAEGAHMLEGYPRKLAAPGVMAIFYWL